MFKDLKVYTDEESREQALPMTPHHSRDARAAARTVGYGSVAVSAWLIAAVATGHGVAYADNSSGSSHGSVTSSSSSSKDSSTDSSSDSLPTSSRPGANLGPRPILSTRDSGSGDDRDDTAIASQAGSTGPSYSAGDDDVSNASDEVVGADVPAEVSSATTAPGAVVDGESPLQQELPVEPGAPVEWEDSDPNGTGLDPAAASPVTKPDGYSASGAGGNDTKSSNGTKTEAGVDPATVKSPIGPVRTETAGLAVAPVTAPSRSTRPSTAVVAAAPAARSTGADAVVPTAVAESNPIAAIAGAVNRFVSALFSPLKALASSVPSGQNPFAWALLAFVRRTFFNQAPKISAVIVGQQQANGVIAGTIDAVDPDEMGKTVKIRANVFAFPAQPRIPEPDCGCAVVDGVAGLPFMNDAYLGTEPGSNWHAPDAVDITCVYIGSTGAVTYTGKEIGEVTIDGLGTGDVTLVFDGVLLSATQERSVAHLQPHRGTGDLKGVRGTVVSESTLDATGAATGVLTGEVVRPEVRYRVVTQPKYGTVAIDAVTGQFTYTPDPAFAEVGGDDSFQVVAADGRFDVLNLFQKYNGDPVTTINLNVASTVTV
jgi:hypothetical protein